MSDNEQLIKRIKTVNNYNEAALEYLQLYNIREALRQLILSWELVAYRTENARNEGEDIKIIKALERILDEQERQNQ